MEDAEEIENGYQKLVEKIQHIQEQVEQEAAELKKRDVDLLSRMGVLSQPLVEKIGMNMLEKGKQDTKGGLYDSRFYSRKMIVLGKADLVSARPDDPAKQVTDQFCLFGEDGAFYEIMYSSDGFLVDSYLNRLEPGDVIGHYGYEPMFMLYRAMRDYLENLEDILAALKRTLEFVFQESGKQV
jgi:hypothetical protein